MKNILLTIFLLSFASNTLAKDKWEFLTQSRDLSTFIYINHKEIIIKDKYIYVWRIQDYNKPDKWGSLSIEVLMQIDCSFNRYKSLYFFFHKKSMGKDKAKINIRNNAQWEVISSDSINEQIIFRVCGDNNV